MLYFCYKTSSISAKDPTPSKLSAFFTVLKMDLFSSTSYNNSTTLGMISFLLLIPKTVISYFKTESSSNLLALDTVDLAYKELKFFD
jgi:hypothetical protein